MSEAIGEGTLNLKRLAFNMCDFGRGGGIFVTNFLAVGVQFLCELMIDLFVVCDDGIHGTLLILPEGEFLLKQLDGFLLLM